MRKIAYLFSLFPVINQTFTLAEVRWLKREGYDLRIISLLSRVESQQQPEAQPLLAETLYCPRMASPQLWAALVRGLRRDPRRVLGMFRLVIVAWREPLPARAREAGSGPATYSFGEWVELVYRANPYIYLFTSLLMVPFALYLSEVLRREHIPHVHCQWATYPATVGMLIEYWSGIPYSIAAHAYDIYMLPRMLPTKLARARFVVTCADYNRRYLSALCEPSAAARIHLNYHGTDLARFRPGTRTRGERFRIISAGWLKEYKGFHVLVEAVAELARRAVPAELHLAGDGPQREYLERLAERLQIRDRVHLHGYLSHERLAELYRECDVFAIASIAITRFGRQDVIPNVLAEAMAVALPVVATRVGGVPELVEDQVDGLLVPQRDTAALADALERLWREPELAARLAAAGRRKVERIWDREANLRELARLFDREVPARHEEAAA